MAASLPQVRVPKGPAARWLRDEGCCGLCVLRFTGVSDRACFRLPLASVERQLDEQIGGTQGGIRSSARAPEARTGGGDGGGPRLPPGVAVPAGGGGGKKVRVFVTTGDDTLFSGAKLVQLAATDVTELCKCIARAIGHPDVTLEVQLNGKTLLAAEGAVAALGNNPRLVVTRAAQQAAAPAAAADTATPMEEAPPGAVAAKEPAAAAEAEPEFVCCACLGLLQHATSSLCAEMISFIRTDGWECPPGQTVLLGIAIPSDVLVRQRLLEMIGYPDQRPTHRLIDLKTTLHQLFGAALEKELGCKLLTSGANVPDNYGLSLSLTWKPKKGVLSDAQRVAASCGPQHGVGGGGGRKRQRNGGGNGGGKDAENVSWQAMVRDFALQR